MRSGSRVVLLSFLLFLAPPATAQTGLATLTGTVTDQTGAVIAGVPIRAVHVDSGTVMETVTSGTGNYTIGQMLIGRWDVTVESPGFKTFRREGLALAGSQTLRLDVSLEVGAANESVTVTAEASLLKTDSGALVHNITPTQIQNLPLTPVGTFTRDPFAFVQTLPGVVFSSNSFMRVNGMNTSQSQIRLDGEVLGQTAFPGITTRTQPSPDAIEEIAVITSNFSAEYGSVSGALFNIRMKSGTNQYHGSVYDYAVNEILNANDPAVHAKNRVRRHDYGFSIGGPIRIPKLYNGINKSFFFWNFEQYRDRQFVQVFNSIPTVPVPAYRDGDFSGLFAALNNANLRWGATQGNRDYVDPLGSALRLGTVFDPATTQQVSCDATVSPDCGGTGNVVLYRSPFPGNRIPVSRFDPVSLAIQNKYIPLPKGPNAQNGVLINNYYNPFYSWRTTSMPSFKLDHNISSKARISFTWQNTDTRSPVQAIGGAEGLPSPITANRGTYENSPNARLNFDYTLRPTVQLHIGTGYSMFNFSDDALEINYNPLQEIGLRGARRNRNFPVFSSTVVATPALGGMNGMGPAAGQGRQPERRPSATVSITWIRNNHTIKYGADFRQDMLPRLTYTNTAGNVGGFGGNSVTWQPALLGLTGFTGNTNVGFAYANFMLGAARSLTLAETIAYRTSKQQWGMYLQDTWRARRGLTIDYGLRWDYGTYTAEDYGRNAGLSLTEPNPSAGGHPGALIYEATCKCRFAKNYPYAIGPRLGVAYTINQRTVIRGGFGVAYGSTGTFGGFTANSATLGTVAEGEAGFYLRDGYPAEVNPQWPVFDPGLGHVPGQVRAAFALLDNNAGRPDRTYQWNVSLQREITRNLVIEASYVGNRNVWQSAGGLQDMNAVSESHLARYGFTVGNLDDATLLNQRFNLLTTAQRATLAARGVLLPYGNFPVTGAAAQTVFQSIRPYPQYNTGISPSNAPLGRSWYDSLQVTLTKRYSHGLQVIANYTWSKNLNHTSSPDVFNRSLGKDIVTINPPQQLRVSFEYQLQRPGPGTFLIGNRWVSYAIGGWAVSGSLFYQSGAFIGRPAHGAANPISRWLGRGPGGAQLKQVDGKYMNPWSVDWVDLKGNRRTDPLDINCKCFDPEKTIVLNPNAWEAVPDATWAADTRQLPFFRGPRRPNEAMNLARNFRLGPEGRYTLQVRVEFQNVFNRLRLPTTPQIAGLNFNAAPTLSSDGRYTAGFGTFGNLRNAGAFGPQRSGQFIARFSF
jgi:hypothetical protein